MREPMTSPREVRFTRAGPRDNEAGLLGWVSCSIGDLVLDGIAVRRTLDGRLALSFPERRGRDGRRHPIIRPRDSEAREAIERQVLAAIDVDGGPR